MAIANKAMTVTGDAVATLVYSNPQTGRNSAGGASNDVTVFVDNGSANTVYVGGTSATTDGTNGAGASAANKGYPIATTLNRSFVLKPGDSLNVFANTTSAITAW